ncbi:MAG: hypothetical protein WCD44_00505 [Candidatus Babeliales bacterium]
MTGTKKIVKRYSSAMKIAIGSCILTGLTACYFKNRKITAAVALGGCISAYLSKVHANWKESQRKVKKAKKIEKDNKKIENCCYICKEKENGVGDELQAASCDNGIHRDKVHQTCMDKALKATGKKCPLCRSYAQYSIEYSLKEAEENLGEVLEINSALLEENRKILAEMTRR